MKKLLVIFTFLLLPFTTHAAIAFDVGSNGAEAGAGTATASWTHTLSTLNNTVIAISVQNLSNVDDITAPTVNGTASTLIAKVTSGGSKKDYVYRFIATTTTNLISVTRSNTTSLMDTASASWTGVDPTNPIDTSTTENVDTGTTNSVSLASTIVNDWFVLFAENNTTVTTASTNTTQRSADGNGVRRGIIGDSNGPQPIGSFTMSVTGNGSSAWGDVMFPLKPFVAPNTTFHGLLQFLKGTSIFLKGTTTVL